MFVIIVIIIIIIIVYRKVKVSTVACLIAH